MRYTVLIAIVIIFLLTPATAPTGADVLQTLYRNNMYRGLVTAWSTIINPFGVNIMETDETAYTYLLALIIMFFLISETFGHSDAIKINATPGSFSLLKPLTSGASISILMVSNWILGFIIKYLGWFPNETFIMNYMLPFGLIYFMLFDLISFVKPAFIKVRTRKAIVFLTSLYAADLGLLTPVMDSIKDIMMAEGANWYGGTTWVMYAMAVCFMMLAKFLQRAQASFMTSQRDYIQAQVAEARYQMYKTLADQSFGGGGS
ncbi:MAG: hypothetical protein QF415_02015 [Candidatus Undinarchaeales archaeon]|jgi:hypothetical protein|nr:hypothetical protein [Candidatus Undinarchaeales archaeon]MDP7493465.1 hypothetical protein [Candidatus Undinarchaeales archaeon]